MTRLGLTTPLRRDCALAVLVTAVSAVFLLLGDDDLSATVLALLSAQTLALCARRAYPLMCLGLVILLQIGVAAAVPPGDGLRGVALAVAVYTCGTLFTARRALAMAGAAVLAEVGGFVAFGVGALTPAALAATAGPQLLLAALIYGGAALLGQNTLMRRRYAVLVDLRAAEAAEAALAAERAHMARELHDVAAHHLTSLIVQATLVERLIDRDPEAARRGAAAVREEGKSTLRNLRLIVGALRGPQVAGGGGAPGLGSGIPPGGSPATGPASAAGLSSAPDISSAAGSSPAAGLASAAGSSPATELASVAGSAPPAGNPSSAMGLASAFSSSSAAGFGPSAGLVPVPGLAMIDELAGEIPVAVSGEPGELSAAADLTFYRVAQEALSNARDHAPGAAVTIAIRHGESGSTLEVRNAPPLARAVPTDRSHRGFGLTGMRERATLIGATLTAGPDDNGGWLVTLTVPHLPHTEES
ncbi:sensor histidine kinase [Catenuloplanes japonicus]|uniref:sensor histidine kinase n=1 Tax=Catenuloplanes japonicus TaxID=33876 RepID=UPI00068AE538|nr:sensor histidine kinase [Catenuloplanes japonicus]